MLTIHSIYFMYRCAYECFALIFTLFIAAYCAQQMSSPLFVLMSQMIFLYCSFKLSHIMRSVQLNLSTDYLCKTYANIRMLLYIIVIPLGITLGSCVKINYLILSMIFLTFAIFCKLNSQSLSNQTSRIIHAISPILCIFSSILLHILLLHILLLHIQFVEIAICALSAVACVWLIQLEISYITNIYDLLKADISISNKQAVDILSLHVVSSILMQFYSHNGFTIITIIYNSVLQLLK